MLKQFKDLLDNDILNGYQLGEVVDVEDNGFRETGNPIFRVKVKIFGVTDIIEKDKLPWYIVKHTPSDTYNEQGRIPRVGTKVFVELLDGTIYNGIVSFQIPKSPPRLKG